MEHETKEGRFNMSGQRYIRYLILPSIAPAGPILRYFTPKTAIGCANRGYLALAIVFLAMVAAIGTTWNGAAAGRKWENEAANRWTVTTLILAMRKQMVERRTK